MSAPVYANGNVRARCPDCGGALTSFDHRGDGNREFGAIVRMGPFEHEGAGFERALYVLVRCAGCGRGGLATVVDNGRQVDGVLIDFHPTSVDRAKLPDGTPPGVIGEYREAELCASVGAWRGASALLRSALEKVLTANGYTKKLGVLQARIDAAAADGAITAARSKRAHDDVRTLGNDILHDDWRAVTAEEYGTAHHYVLRVIEDLYDDRATVEQLLVENGRLALAEPAEGPSE